MSANSAQHVSIISPQPSAPFKLADWISMDCVADGDPASTPTSPTAEVDITPPPEKIPFRYDLDPPTTFELALKIEELLQHPRLIECSTRVELEARLRIVMNEYNILPPLQGALVTPDPMPLFEGPNGLACQEHLRPWFDRILVSRPMEWVKARADFLACLRDALMWLGPVEMCVDPALLVNQAVGIAGANVDTVGPIIAAWDENGDAMELDELALPVGSSVFDQIWTLNSSTFGAVPSVSLIDDFASAAALQGRN